MSGSTIIISLLLIGEVAYKLYPSQGKDGTALATQAVQMVRPRKFAADDEAKVFHRFYQLKAVKVLIAYLCSLGTYPKLFELDTL